MRKVGRFFTESFVGKEKEIQRICYQIQNHNRGDRAGASVI